MNQQRVHSCYWQFQTGGLSEETSSENLSSQMFRYGHQKGLFALHRTKNQKSQCMHVAFLHATYIEDVNIIQHVHMCCKNLQYLNLISSIIIHTNYTLIGYKIAQLLFRLKCHQDFCTPTR